MKMSTTRIPFGSVNLLHGVDENESKAKGDEIRQLVLGSYIVLLDAGIGTSIDSFYEYLLKAIETRRRADLTESERSGSDGGERRQQWQRRAATAAKTNDRSDGGEEKRR
ncbi:hypothetical protein GW17_00000363 [Ensete ventricosum]|nr:hypothetical protein GW17_00000363 [Ensete ventricosum]